MSSSEPGGAAGTRAAGQRSAEKKTMRRINVRLGTGSWTLLGALAQAHGVSRCYLFNYLLYLEEVGVGDSIEDTMNAGVPTFHKHYSYILHLDLTFNRATRRLQCFPESSFYAFEYREWHKEPDESDSNEPTN
ncbi:DUF1564 family protein [Leptospira gomenensis]|nr:DUF1564 family protein [Leptospira gomenensis]TGK49536.1 DUF1564 family protein [Leptospira gomenensis]